MCGAFSQAKEPLSRLFEPGSASRALFFNYTRTMVSRYAATDTVLMWEVRGCSHCWRPPPHTPAPRVGRLPRLNLTTGGATLQVGNEYNLLADLNLTQQQPLICTRCGTPQRRTRADNFSTPMLVQLQRDITAVIRAADKLGRPISSGCSIPRPQAWHLMQSYHQPRRDWTADTRAQFQQMLLMVNDAFDVVNVHYYNHSMLRWNLTSYTGVLELVLQAASGAGMPLYACDAQCGSVGGCRQPPLTWDGLGCPLVAGTSANSVRACRQPRGAQREPAHSRGRCWTLWPRIACPTPAPGCGSSLSSLR